MKSRFRCLRACGRLGRAFAGQGDGYACVDEEGLARDPARLVAGEKDRGPADIPGGAFVLDDPGRGAGLAPLRGQPLGDEGRINLAGSDAIDADMAVAELAGEGD